MTILVCGTCGGQWPYKKGQSSNEQHKPGCSDDPKLMR